MREPASSSRCVVVGTDGSRSALRAALWAVDEAIDRSLPMRLVHATTSAETAHAQSAIRDAVAAVAATDKPVKIETDIVHDRPLAALLTASRSAAMVCVGSTGLQNAVHGHIGSTATAVANSAHCPVAVVPTTSDSAPTGTVLAVVDEAHLSRAVVELAIREARLRSAQLQVMTARSRQGSGLPEIDNVCTASARLERGLASWRRSNPDVDIRTIARVGGVINYLAHSLWTAQPVHIVVVDPVRPGPTDILLGPSGREALDAARCALVLCDRQSWL
ncbi:universal stress protein [Mycobacterium sp.]|uniref:universal stress protein n=1 Tax=Mycobacterium sp. TaxID=1785 RepID=UPI0031D8B5A2